MHAELPSHSTRQNTEPLFIMHRFIIASISSHQIVTPQETIENYLLYKSVASWLFWEQLSLLKTRLVAVFYDFTDRCIFFNQQQGVPDPELAWLSIHLTDGHRQTENTNTSVLKWRQTLMVVWKICTLHRKVSPSLLLSFGVWIYSFLFDCHRTTDIYCIPLRNYSACHKTLEGWFVTISVLSLLSVQCVLMVCVCAWLSALYTKPSLFIVKVRVSLPTDFSVWSKFSGVLWENSGIFLNSRCLGCYLTVETESSVARREQMAM